jgi:hypothetical protein
MNGIEAIGMSGMLPPKRDGAHPGTGETEYRFQRHRHTNRMADAIIKVTAVREV